jgi:shikimate kinase
MAFAACVWSVYTLNPMTQSPTDNSVPMATRSAIDKSIVLVGLMGVGKSTIGRRLAGRLGLPFVDSDDEIESAAGMKVGELFEEYGEDYFRDGERRVITRLIDGETKVIATGGGAFVQDETRALILAEATAIWLDADIDILAERVSRRDTRPLVRGADPKAVLTALAEKRNPFYAQAQFHIQSGEGVHEETVDRILEALAA